MNIKNFLKYSVLILFALFAGKVASASVLNGSISFAGAGTVTSTGITFPAASQSVSVAPPATGDLSDFVFPHLTQFNPNFTFAGISAVGGEQMLSEVSNDTTDDLAFQVTSYATVDGKLVFYGTLTLSNASTNAVISSNTATLVYTNSGPNTFSAALTTAPEPNSLLLLGTGLVCAAGVMLRRRRKVNA